MAWVLIILLALMAVSFLLLKIGDLFSPWMITTLVWLAILILFQFSGNLLYPLQSRFYTCVIIWVLLMSATSIITYYAFPSAKELCQSENDIDIARDIHVNELFYMMFFTISMVCTPLYVYNIYKVISMFGTQDIFFNLRIFASAGEKDMLQTLLIYVNAINQALFIIEMWRYPNGNKWRFIAIILASFMCAVAIMEKGALFFMLTVSLFILYEKGHIKIRTIILWGIILLFTFHGINQMRTSENTVRESTFLDFFNVYVMSPSVAFERVQEKLTEQYGSRSFAFFYAVITRLGLGQFVVEPKLQEFSQVPMFTNVYTVFQPFFEDFGYKGIAFFSTVYGVFTGWLYRQCRNGGAISKCMYAYIVEILVLQFYQENLILSLSMLVQYLFVFFFVLQRRIGVTFNTNYYGAK